MLTRRQVPGIIPAIGKKHRHYDGKANGPFVDDYLGKQLRPHANHRIQHQLTINHIAVPAERTKRTGRTTAKLDEKVQEITSSRTFYGT